MLSVTAVMILPPYLACTAYLWKICAKKEYPEGMPVKFGFAFFCGVAGTLYALWMIYAAGVTYLLMAFVFLLLGIPFYLWACRDNAEEARKAGKEVPPVFTKLELGAAIVIGIVAIAAVILFATGTVKL